MISGTIVDGFLFECLTQAVAVFVLMNLVTAIIVAQLNVAKNSLC